MENINNADQQRIDQQSSGPLEGMSPQVNLDQNKMPPSDEPSDQDAVYTDFSLDAGGPDVMNPGEEASDSILYTDNKTARHAMDHVSNDVDYDSLPEDKALRDEEIDRLTHKNASGTDETDRYLAY